MSEGTGIAGWTWMFDWQRARQLLGETVREVGVLILVFAPLDVVLADRPIRSGLVVTITPASLVIACGILMEARKHRP